MRFCRFDDDRLGVVEGEEVRDVTRALDALPCDGAPPPADVILKRLVANPGKLIAAPVNYKAHLEEAKANEATFSRAHVRRIKETDLFLEATSSLIGAGKSIVIRHPQRRTDHEFELAVIGRDGRDNPRDQALNHVPGYSIGLDITVRGPEGRSLRKSLDSYAVLGPTLVTSDEFDDPSGLELSLSVNGELRARTNTRDLIPDVPALIAFAWRFYTLHPGDVLFTGTSESVAPIGPGDRIETSIEKVGTMHVDVVRS